MRSPPHLEVTVSALPSNTVRRGEPSRTAHWVAALRAVHQLLDEPLVLPDPIALSVLGVSAEAALRDDPFVLNDPLSRGVRAAIVARSRFVEDELLRRVAAGVRQYVLLGAGLDTFAYRSALCVGPRSPATATAPRGGEQLSAERPSDSCFADPQLRVFEVDHAGTQRWKQQLLAEAGIHAPSALSFVPLDFERDDLGAALAQAGFRSDQPACVSWMGVTTYLTADAVLRMLRAMAGLAAGSCVCFDYRVPAAMLDPVERMIDEVIGRKAAAAGEPWLSTFDPAQLQAQLLEAGFGSADSTTPDDLNACYFARRKDGLRLGGSLRIMCARTAGVP
jgi:O-methyltransferase involved in polyketide biosynthesis